MSAVVTLAPEAKHLADTIKMVAYRAETTVVHSLAPHVARTEDQEWALIRELLVSSADTIPDRDTKCLQVRVHSLANPRSDEALTTLCETLNALQLPLSGSGLEARLRGARRCIDCCAHARCPEFG